MAKRGNFLLMLGVIFLFPCLASAQQQPAVVVSAAPVMLESSATLRCTVDSSMLQEGTSLSSLEYEWTVGGEVEQTRSQSHEHFINSAQVINARDDYGCDVFASGQQQPLFSRAFGSLRVIIPNFGMTFRDTTSNPLRNNYVGQNVSYACRTVVTFPLTDLVGNVAISNPRNVSIVQEEGRVSISALTSDEQYERVVSFSPLSAGDAGEYSCTGTVMPTVANPLVTNGKGNVVVRNLRLFDPTLNVLLSPPAPRLLDIFPYNSVTLTCSSSATVNVVSVPLVMEMVWHKATGGSSLSPVPPEAFTTSSQLGSSISTLRFNTSQPGDYTFSCQVILDVSPAPDLFNTTESVTVEVIGPSPPSAPIPSVPNVTLFHNAAIVQWRVAALTYDPEEYTVFYGTSDTELIFQSDLVNSGDDITRTNFNLSVELEGLNVSTRYYYTVQANNSVGTTHSPIQTFTTTGLLDCGDLVVPSNANGSIDAVTSITEGATVSFQCEEGHFLPSGHNTTLIQCTNVDNMGLWIPNPATLLCRPEDSTILPVPTTTTSSPLTTATTSSQEESSTIPIVIGVVVAALLLLVVIGIVVAVSLCYVKPQRRKAKLDTTDDLYEDVDVIPWTPRLGNGNAPHPQPPTPDVVDPSSAYEEVDIPIGVMSDQMELKDNVAYGKIR